MPAQKGNKFGKNTDGTPAVYWTPERIKEASKEIFNEIVLGKSVRSILNPKTRDKKKYPSFVTFLEWLSADNDLSKQYARAMEWRAEGLLEDTIDIADDSTGDMVDMFDENDGYSKKADVEHIQRTRLRIEARQFALRKMAPKKYGDRLDVTSDGDKLNRASSIAVSIAGAPINLSLRQNADGEEGER